MSVLKYTQKNSYIFWNNGMETPRSALCVAVALPKEIRVFYMGYFKLPDWLVDNCMKEISSSDFCLLIFYCRVANSRGESWYSQTNISETTGLSVRQVGKSMHALHDAHFLSFRAKGNRTRIVKLNEEIVKAIKQPKKLREPAQFNVRFSEIATQKMLT